MAFVGRLVHLGRDFPCAVNLLLLRQSGDGRPAGVVLVNVAWATKNLQTGHRPRGMDKSEKKAFETGNSSRVKTRWGEANIW